MKKNDYSFASVPGSDRIVVFDHKSLQYEFVDDMDQAENLNEVGFEHELSVKPCQVQTSIIPAMRTSKPMVRSVTFMATMDCNLRCEYCYMKKDEGFLSKKKMTAELAIECLTRYLHPSSVDRLTISFLGGEPTLNMDLIFKVMHWVRANYKSSSFCVTTNATRLHTPMQESVSCKLVDNIKDITIGEWLVRHNFDALISLDGPKEVNDKNRIDAGGKGSFDTIMRGFAHLKEVAPKWLAHRTMRGSYGDDLVDGVSFLERLKFFNSMIDKGFGGYVAIEATTIDPKNFDEITNQLHDAVEWYISEIQKGNTPQWIGILKAIRLLYLNKPRKQFCGAGAGKLAFGVDGEIHACHNTSDKSEVGHIKTGIDPEKDGEWKAVLDVDSMDKCSTCDIRYFCAGGCRAAHYAENDDLGDPTETTCFVQRLMMYCAFRAIDALDVKQLDKLTGRK